MRRYALLSGTIFAIIACAQLWRAALAVPVQMGSFVVPPWYSFVVALGAAAIAVWAFRVAQAAK